MSITEIMKGDYHMKQYTGRIIGTRYSRFGESLIACGLSIHIDRTTRGEEWNREHGMTPAYTVTAGTESFTVWTGSQTYENGKLDLACAVPI